MSAVSSTCATGNVCFAIWLFRGGGISVQSGLPVSLVLPSLVNICIQWIYEVLAPLALYLSRKVVWAEQSELSFGIVQWSLASVIVASVANFSFRLYKSQLNPVLPCLDRLNVSQSYLERSIADRCWELFLKLPYMRKRSLAKVIVNTRFNELKAVFVCSIILLPLVLVEDVKVLSF